MWQKYSVVRGKLYGLAKPYLDSVTMAETQAIYNDVSQLIERYQQRFYNRSYSWKRAATDDAMHGGSTGCFPAWLIQSVCYTRIVYATRDSKIKA
jgi:hypothetical protein